MNKTILVVPAHSDDEALGCGGTIARHAADGDNVYAVFIADGVNSRAQTGREELANRHVAAEKAKKILGIQENVYLDLPDNRLDQLPLLEIVQCLEKVILKVKPNVIYTHHYGDLNVDHRITHQAVLTVCRPTPNCTIQDIYTFEVMSSSEWSNPHRDTFIPNHYVNIEDYLIYKLEALEAYNDEMREHPHSRSINHISYLAYHRGNSVGIVAAEAFATVRTMR